MTNHHQPLSASKDQHPIAKAEETIALALGYCVGFQQNAPPRVGIRGVGLGHKGADQHEQGRAGQVKVGDQRIHGPVAVARTDAKRLTSPSKAATRFHGPASVASGSNPLRTRAAQLGCARMLSTAHYPPPSQGRVVDRFRRPRRQPGPFGVDWVFLHQFRCHRAKRVQPHVQGGTVPANALAHARPAAVPG